MKLCCIIILSFLSRVNTHIPYQAPTHSRYKNKEDSMRIMRAIKSTFKKLRKEKLLVP